MTFSPRIITSLLIDRDKLIKTKKFNDERYVGDILNAVKIFNDKNVDELLIIDKSIKSSNDGPNYDLIKQLSSEAFIPICYGGGIRNLNQAYRLFKIGIEKISVQKMIYDNFSNLTNLVKNFGSSSILFSIDIINYNNSYYIFDNKTKKNLHLNLYDTINKAVDYGVGEILINIVNLEGTLKGPNIDIIKHLPKANIPIVYQGGISSVKDIINVLKNGFHSVAIGSYFVFYGKYNSVLISYINEFDRFNINKNISLDV